MGRIVGNLVGGPRDGQQVSVDEDQTEVESGERAGDDGEIPVGVYVKDAKKLRPAEAADLRDPHPNSTEERPVADVERFDHPLEQVCDFVYKAD